MRRLFGRASIALAVSATLVAVAGPATAKDQTAEITGSTVYASPITDAVPRAILNLANPSLMCIFAPEACPPEAADLLLLASDPMGVLVDPNARPEPVQPAVPPGTIAVGLLGGTVRYQAALQFDVPKLPKGKQFDTFEVVLTQEQPTYNISSPLFREIVNAALVVPDDPELGGAALQEAFAATPIEQKVLDVRVCPLKKPFDSNDAPTTASDDEIPHDEYGAPEVTCRLGSFGEYDEASGTWTFDLAAAANEWATGGHAKHGLFVQPIPINFVGLGDEDPTTFAQVTFDATAVTIRSTLSDVVEALPEVPTLPAEPVAAGGETGISVPPPVAIPSGGNDGPAEPAVAPAPPVEAPVESPAAVGTDAVAAPNLTPAATETVPERLRLSALLALLAAGTGALWLAMRRTVPKPVSVA